MKNGIINTIRPLLFSAVILFFASAGFQDKSTSGWYQQYFPNLNGSTIQDITFLDSLTGFAVTNPGNSIYCYILKTTNGGDNWATNYTYNSGTNIRFTKVQFVDSNVGYASTNFFDFFKTTNAGLNWIQIANPDGAEDMAVINKDTVLVVTSDGFAGGVYRSTNGGVNWQYIWNNSPNGNPSKIYMYDKNLGFTQDAQNFMRRTTNGGFNWSLVTGEIFSGIEFKDSLIGWKAHIGVQKTTNGGLSWINQQLPNISSSFVNSDVDIVNNTDTVWMVGARKYKQAPIYKTTNGGLNWGYQIPDTSYPIYSYRNIQVVTSKFGWVLELYGTDNILFHTSVGGKDTTYFTGIKLIENFVPSEYILGQNYPNPFNPVTNIPFELREPSHITLKVYDAHGREVKELVNGRWGTGRFIADFDGSGLPSGVYFYKIVINGETTGQSFSETKRMIMIK